MGLVTPVYVYDRGPGWFVIFRGGEAGGRVVMLYATTPAYRARLLQVCHTTMSCVYKHVLRVLICYYIRTAATSLVYMLRPLWSYPGRT